MKAREKSFEAWKIIMISIAFLSYCIYTMPGENTQIIYQKYMNNGNFGATFFFMLSGFGIGLSYHKKFMELNKKDYLQFLKKKLAILYPLYMIMQTLYLILALCSHPGAAEIRGLILKYIISIPMLQSLIPDSDYYLALNPAGWFVSVLFLSYLLAPVMCMLAAKVKRNLSKTTLVLICMILAYILLAGPLAGVLGLEADVQYLFPMNFLLFCIGIWLANYKLNMRIDTDRMAGRNLLTILELLVIAAGVCIYFAIAGSQGWKPAALTLLLYICIVVVYSYDGGMVSHIVSYVPFGIFSSMVFDFYLIQYFMIRYIGTAIQSRIDSGKNFVLSIMLTYIISWAVVMVIKFIKKVYRSARYRISSCTENMKEKRIEDDYLDIGYEEIDQSRINTNDYDRGILDPMSVEVSDINEWNLK